MNRYVQAFDTPFREKETRRPKQRVGGAAAADLLRWPAELDDATPPQSNAMEDLLGLHEYERQRFGQDLHDSAGQLLVSLQLSVAHLLAVETDHRHDVLLHEINDTVRLIDREIRALAFLNYPAELGDRGLCGAIQALTLGFAKRTGIRTSFKCLGDPAPVERSIAKAVLRVAQEALANIHRHSRATCAKVVLERRDDQLRLTVSDDGIGMPIVAMLAARGIGLPGMRHRIEMLGGRFQMRNLKHGARISATVPLAATNLAA